MHNRLQIFFALLSGVVLNSTSSGPNERQVMAYLLMGLQAVPPFCTVFLSSSLSKYVLDKESRKKLFNFVGKARAAAAAPRACALGCIDGVVLALTLATPLTALHTGPTQDRPKARGS